jgi:hypothetical protein
MLAFIDIPTPKFPEIEFAFIISVLLDKVIPFKINRDIV